MARKVERKLTTILCADVQGYSELMGRDEVGTLGRLKQHRAAMAALVDRHGGRVVNTWGDGVLAEFPSVVEAVQCAVETQNELGARNAALDGGQRLEFRIGINLGDVMLEEGDLYGEGVNVAARLQNLAEPGGIVISGTVHDHVRGKLAVAYEYAGPQRVKNIAEPVPAFRVRVGAAAGAPTGKRRGGEPTTTRDRIPASLKRQTAICAVVALFLLLVNLFSSPNSLWFHWPSLVMALVLGVAWARRL
jgi:adenylate cyclase